jgi:hypothetical protein
MVLRRFDILTSLTWSTCVVATTLQVRHAGSSRKSHGGYIKVQVGTAAPATHGYTIQEGKFTLCLAISQLH